MKTTRFTTLSAFTLLTLAGCPGNDPETPPPAACTAPTAGPTIHDEDIVGHEVWRADEGPHIVEGTLDVRDGATLEIEPCSVVQLGAGADLNVAFPGTPNTGTLLAEGTLEQPIRFEGLDDARWGRIYVQSPGTARLAHVTIEGGGATDPSGASLTVQGQDTFPTQRGLFVDHVTVTGSLGAGVVAGHLATFAEGSTALVVTASGSDEHPYPLEIDEHVMDTLPDGDYRGNQKDEIFVNPAYTLQESGTVRALGVPYHIGDSTEDRLVVGSGDPDGVPVTLTIEPGVTMAFHPGMQLAIERSSGDFAASGVLVAVGTEAAPIVLTSAADVPAAGDWVGLWMGGIVRPETRLEHVRIEYTGADCGCVLSSCSNIDRSDGAVILTQPPPAVFANDVVISHAASHGFVMGYQGDTFDFASTNEFEDVAGCPMTLPSAPVCPNPRPACL